MLNQESLIDDITRRAQEGLLAEAYGRARETFAVMEVLTRRNRKNVLLTGYAGVGKRRIVEGLALAGVQGETEGLLGEFRVVALNLGLLAQGGESHSKALMSLIKHLRQTRDIILFIPDIDLVLGPDAGELGDDSIVSLLRPALLRGDITCIGSTTPGRYRDIIEPDSAARRAFEVLPIEPMTEVQAYEVITAIRPEIEAHHDVELSDETIRAAVILSERYIKHLFLPGKAIDVLDRASSRYRLKKLATERRPELVDDASLVMLKDRVSPHDVRKAVENVVGYEIRASYTPEYWEGLAASFRRRMTGQNTAISASVVALRKAYEQLSESGGPKCVLLLVGPQKSGKRYWADTLAEFHLGHMERCFEIDLATATEESLPSILESAAGWGIESQSRQDSTGLVHLPDSIVYITGIDNAPKASLDRLKRVLDGSITTMEARRLSLHNCVVLLASERPEALPERADYKESPKSWRVGLRQTYPPEILNRVNASIPFFPLEFRHHHAIMRNDVNALRQKLSKRGVTVVVHRNAYEYLSANARSNGSGVQELRKDLYAKLIRPVEQLMTQATDSMIASVRVEVVDGQIACRLERTEGSSVGAEAARPDSAGSV